MSLQDCLSFSLSFSSSRSFSACSLSLCPPAEMHAVGNVLQVPLGRNWLDPLATTGEAGWPVAAFGLSLDRSRVVSIISGGVLAETRAILGVEAWSRLEMSSGVFRLGLFLLSVHNIY